MLLVVQRTDTLSEMRALVNTDDVVAVMPVAGGVRTKLHLSNGDTWEIPFTRASAVFREEIEQGA
jgi:hypothetical protein